MIETNRIYNMDCLEGMKKVPDESVDMILCDLPYGITDHAWDTIIPFDKLWEAYERIIKPKAAIVLTANLGFTNQVINSNLKLYKYKWIWIKNNATNYINANNRPMSKFEEILIFSKGKTANNPEIQMKYFPQGLIRKVDGGYTNYPKDVLNFKRDIYTFHPTQKPLALFEYLIKTYTKEGELVMDNCMGSGTTAVACLNTNRRYIGFETNKDYYEKSLERIKSNVTQLTLF